MNKIYPFSNATEFMQWTDNNCDLCIKNKKCKSEEAISLGSVTDGAIHLSVANRIGLIDNKLSNSCRMKQTERKITNHKKIIKYDKQQLTLPNE